MRPHPLAVAAVALAVLSPAAASARPKPSNSVESQLSFGVKMARQGLWSEALFRFQEAEKIDPQNARILSNLGVAYEATGRFDQALDAYQRALKAAPADKDIRNNYARFVEFYQGYKGEKKSKDTPTVAQKPDPARKPNQLPRTPGLAEPEPMKPSDMPTSPPEDGPPPPADD